LQFAIARAPVLLSGPLQLGGDATMTFKQFLAFAKVARHLNVTKAANELGTSEKISVELFCITSLFAALS
jgi:hypothetical protein